MFGIEMNEAWEIVTAAWSDAVLTVEQRHGMTIAVVSREDGSLVSGIGPRITAAVIDVLSSCVSEIQGGRS